MSRGLAAHGHLASVLGAATLAALVFLPTVGFDFTNWDDPGYVVDNPVLVSGKLWQLLDPATTTAGAWTPLTNLSFALERALFGLEPAAYHVTNVALHAGCTALVALLLLGTGVSPAGAFLGAAIFGIHPVQVESVAWVSGRKTLLSTLLLLGALVTFRRSARGSAWTGALLGSLALLAKPTAVVVAPLALLDRLRTGAGSWRRTAGALALLAAAALAVGLLAMDQQEEARAEIAGEPAGVRLLTMARVGGSYLQNLVSPLDLAAHYPVVPVRGADPRAIAWLVAIALGGGAVAWWLRQNREALFFLAWIPAAAFPHLNAIGGPYWMADRYLYVPLVGVAGLLGLVVSSSLARFRPVGRLAVAAGMAALLGFYGALSARRVEVWSSSEELWQDTVQKSPAFAAGFVNLASALASQGRHEEAAQGYARALELRPGDPGILASLGNEYDQLGRTMEALALYEAALKADAASFDAHYNLALVLQREGYPARALGHYRRALEAEPGSWAAWNNLGNTYGALGSPDPTPMIESYRRALEANPSYTPALVNLGDALRRLGRFAEAEMAYRRAADQDPALIEAHYGLALVAAAQGELHAARDQLLRVLELDPGREAARRSLTRVDEQLLGAEPSP